MTERTGLNMYAENTQQQLTFLALLPWCDYGSNYGSTTTKLDIW